VECVVCTWGDEKFTQNWSESVKARDHWIDLRYEWRVI
jgi:hypothetical protein